MKNTKGIELALNTVVIIAVLLLVAVIIISFFLGATGKVFGPIANLLTGGTEQMCKSAEGIAIPCGEAEEESAYSFISIRSAFSIKFFRLSAFGFQL